MGQSPSSLRMRGSRQHSFRGFMRRSKNNKSNLSHTFNLHPCEEFTELMNVNTATEEQLMTLPGVNRQLARDIVLYRQIIGRFKRVDDLALVSGIGAEKLEILRPEICTNTRKQASQASSCTQSLESIRIASEHKLCSINSCSVFQLQCVPGLNQEIAANIIDHRTKRGPFKSLDDLIKVRGMDIVRLSAVKVHLTLESRKSESAHNLNNGYVNGITEKLFSESVKANGVSSTPRTPHRKSLSMPPKLPPLTNGFSAFPVNDILELLSAYSHRPIVEEVFTYERDGVRCCRLASWNLHQLSSDKILNPGVREVVCRTILEHKLSLIAVQDVVEEAALVTLRDELNSPGLPRVREWKANSQRWECCVSKKGSPHLGFIYDSNTKGITIEDIQLEQLGLQTEATEVRNLVEELANLKNSQNDRYYATAKAFLICGRPIVIINVQCRGDWLMEEDYARLRRVTELAQKANVQMVVLGDLYSWDNVEAIKTCESLLNDTVNTSLTTTPGQGAILSPGSILDSQFNGRSGVIRSGLSHLAIPRGWSWGGPASPHCPVWAEIKLPD